MRTRAIGLVLAALGFAGCGFLPGIAWGQTGPAPQPAGLSASPIGKVLTTTGSATIEHSSAVLVQANLATGGAGQAKVGDLVYQGDVVQTGADGTIGIVFGDGTSFDVSKNARMELNEFVYDPKSNSNSTLFNLKKGTFTFLAGKIAKSGNMRVETPVGTMGIRGTAPHVEILDDGTVNFSTLVEENKNSPIPAAARSPRRIQNPTPDGATRQKSEKDLDKRLNICRGC